MNLLGPAFYLIFVLQIIIIAVLVWLIRTMRLRLRDQDVKIAESLDDLDLAQFQDDVSGVLTQLAKAGESLVKKTSERERALEKTVEKAKALERKLTGRLSSLENQLRRVEGRELAIRSRVVLAAPISRAEPDLDGEEDGPQEPDPIALSPVSPTRREGEGELDRSSVLRKVRELAGEGLNAEQISRSLGMLRGEVELIMRLVPRKD